MEKEKSKLENTIPLNSPEDISRQDANGILELESPEAFRIVLYMLKNELADLVVTEKDGRESAVVRKKVNKEDVYMTKEPSEIAMLKDPIAGLQFLGKLSPLD